MVMEILWDEQRPMTGIELIEYGKENEWKSNYIYNVLISLQKKEMIEMCGVIKCGKQYIRQFVPSVSKEQYVAKMASTLKMKADSIPKVALALAQELDEDDTEIIVQLEEIIKSFKEKIKRENE